MIRAYFSSLPPLKQKLWANFREYERALVTTEQENSVSEKTHVSLRIVEIYDFLIFFFIFTLLLLFCYISLVHIITILDSLFLNAYGNIKYGLVQSFNFIVNARTESCLQDVELGHEETVYLGSTLGLILNCFVKHYGSKFLISEQEALCLILEPYYDCFLVP